MTLLLALLAACGGTPHGHDHEEGVHEHGIEANDHGTETHEDAVEAHPDDAHTEPGSPLEAKLGAHTARLEPSADALRLVVLDGSGAPIAAEGEAKVVLTGTGQEEQRLVLTAEGEGWSGAAEAEGASGYVAVVSVPVDGAQQTARITWGEVPEAKPAPAKGDHDAGGAHDHGDGGHAH